MPKKKPEKAKGKRAVRRPKAAPSKAKRAIPRKVGRKRVKGEVAGDRGIKKGPPEAALEKIGEVTHYFPHVKAAAVRILKDSLKIGEKVLIKGHTTDFKEKIVSMQVDHVPVTEGKKAQEIGLLVKSRVRIGDSLYRI